ncbi:TIGR04141 family sporadically distributed protein [Nocardia sp. NRRL S-836]|uniref:TIGR04141 family sporadically distributed protein n=1 Tax=Nocardia sp. NRRL S-836 TaxID=1519492 RepID=UPI0006AEE415|nr:TIGR04141 family sporadically distributed protein [Nocardia sp. NRRL S-836]
MARQALPTAVATIYRFPKTHQRLSDYLKEVEGVDLRVNGELTIADTRTHVLAGVRENDEPHWVRHFSQVVGVDADLRSTSPFAVIVVEIDESSICAVTWGTSGRHLLDDLLLDDDFGLDFGIRRIDPAKLRLVRSNLLDVSARGMEISFPSGNALSGFPLEPAGELVTGIEGPADMTGLTYDTATGGRSWQIRAGRSLSIQLGRSPEDFISDLRTICAVADEDAGDAPLRRIAEVRPVSENDAMMSELESRLAAALGGDAQHGPLGLCWPASALGEIGQANSYIAGRIGSVGSRVLDPAFEVETLVEPFVQVDVSRRVAVLRDAELTPCADDAGEEVLTRPISMIKWVAFETSVGGRTYCLHQGKWYEIGQEAVDRVHAQVRELLRNRSSLAFPLWVPTGKPKDEHDYCELVARQNGYLCLDRTFARTPMHPRFELADIIGPADEIVHVKWLGRATAASHLYTQAQVSAWAQRFEPQAMEQLQDKVRAIDSGRAITDRPKVVVLAVGGREWDVDQLFTLSQVSLLRLSQELRNLGLELQFADIPFIAKRKGKSAGTAA